MEYFYNYLKAKKPNVSDLTGKELKRGFYSWTSKVISDLRAEGEHEKADDIESLVDEADFVDDLVWYLHRYYTTKKEQYLSDALNFIAQYLTNDKIYYDRKTKSIKMHQTNIENNELFIEECEKALAI